MQCILQRCSTPLQESQLSFMFEGNTISLNICNPPFKETQLPSIWTGAPFIWRKGFTHHKENCTFPKASHPKGKLHIPKEYLRMFSIYTIFLLFNSGVWRMHLIDTWCLRGQMNQIRFGLIWIKAATTSLIISSPPLPHTRKNKHTNILDDLFWVGFWKGMGTKRKTW